MQKNHYLQLFGFLKLQFASFIPTIFFKDFKKPAERKISFCVLCESISHAAGDVLIR